jgi:hypothetical protein
MEFEKQRDRLIDYITEGIIRKNDESAAIKHKGSIQKD